MGGVTNGIRAQVIKLGWWHCAHCCCVFTLQIDFCEKKKIYIFISTDLCCVVYSGAGMAEGDEIYVDLRDEDNAPDPNAPMMAILQRLQQELAEIKKPEWQIVIS